MRPPKLHPLWLTLHEVILTASEIALDETAGPVLVPGAAAPLSMQ